MNFHNEVDEISIEDLEAAASVWDRLVDGSFYSNVKKEHMMVTVSEIRAKVFLLNKTLEHLGTSNRVHFEQRNNYYALDTVDSKGIPRRTLKSGMSKKQVYDFLYAMEETLEMMPDPC